MSAVDPGLEQSVRIIWEATAASSRALFGAMSLDIVGTVA
jgi:hypothetical protein